MVGHALQLLLWLPGPAWRCGSPLHSTMADERDQPSPLHAFEQQVQATAASQQALADAADQLQKREPGRAQIPYKAPKALRWSVGAEMQAMRDLTPAAELAQQCSRLPKLEQRAKRIAETLAAVQVCCSVSLCMAVCCTLHC